MLLLRTFFLVLVLSLPCHAATRYVTKSGSDSNSCASAQNSGTARLTINGAIACMVSGDTLIIGTGTYNELVSHYAGTTMASGTTNSLPSGSSGQPTIVKGGFDGPVTIRSSVGDPGSNALVTLGDSQYVTMEDLILDGERAHYNVVLLGAGSEADHIRFVRVEVKNAVGQGLQGQSNNTEFINLHVHDNGTNGGVTICPADTCGEPTNGFCPGYCHGIYVKGTNLLLDGGTWHHNDGYGIHLYPGVYNSTIRNAVSHSNSIGIGIISGNSNTITNNISYGNSYLGMWIGTANSIVTHNTLYGNAEIGLNLGSGGFTAENNIISGSFFDINATASGLLNNNCITGDIYNGNGATITNTMTSDPLFVNAAGADFHLQSSSPAKLAGTDAKDLGVDFTQFEADTVAPTVSITAPAPSATVSGTAVSVTADAADNVGVVGVQFKLDGANLGAEDTTSTYGITWNSSLAGNGSHTLTAVARDAAGNTTTSAGITVTVATGETTPPTVSITAPAPAATVSGSAVSVTANASDNVGVVGVQFKLDGSNLGTEDTTSTYGITWNTMAVADGTHVLTAVARDAAGNSTTSATVTVTVNNGTDTTPPTVYINTPVDAATVSGISVYVQAQASDNVDVVGVQFKLDGNNLLNENSAAPWNVYWNTTTATDGAHALTAVARDAAGNTTTSSTINVTVDNGTVSLLAEVTSLSISAASTITFLGEVTGLSVVENGTVSLLAEVTSLSISAASTITFLGEVTGLSVVSP